MKKKLPEQSGRIIKLSKIRKNLANDVNMKNHPNTIENRHFTCNKCGYKVQVHGEMYFDYGCHNFMTTFCCKKCNILFEGIISQRTWLRNGKPDVVDEISLKTVKDNIHLTFDLVEKEDIICLNCGTTDNDVWNKDTGVCPRCGGEMTYSVDGEIRVNYER